MDNDVMSEKLAKLRAFDDGVTPTKWAAVAAETEACAEVVESLWAFRSCREVADAIRARGDTDALAERDARVKAEALREVAHLMPRHYGVWSSTGVHIGTWDDGVIAAKVLGEYPGGVMRDLIDMDAILALIPDQHKEELNDE